MYSIFTDSDDKFIGADTMVIFRLRCLNIHVSIPTFKGTPVFCAPSNYERLSHVRKTLSSLMCSGDVSEITTLPQSLIGLTIKSHRYKRHEIITFLEKSYMLLALEEDQ